MLNKSRWRDGFALFRLNVLALVKIMHTLAHYLSDFPFIAILRGVQPHECIAIADVLVEAGFRAIEVPLNSPDAIRSIQLLAQHLPETCLVGAGTVLDVAQVKMVADVGGKLIVMPHADTAVIAESKLLQMLCTPGVATLTEAFAALHAGADGLKLFPSESVPPSVLKAWRTVLPADTICLPVGGIKADAMLAYIEAGARGFGLGSNLYRAGMSVAQVRDNALAYAHAWREIET